MIQQLSHNSTFLPLAVSQPSSLERHVRWSWDLPLWATLLLAVGAVLWISVIYFRENSPASGRLRALLILMRFTAVALILIMFAQPVEQWYRHSKPRLVALVDCSASMATVDVAQSGEVVSRLTACQTALTKGDRSQLDRLQEDYDLDIVTFDEDSRWIVSEENGIQDELMSLTATDDPQKGTRLGDALNFVFRELPGPLPTAVVVFTDGVSNRGKKLLAVAERAQGLSVPVFPVAIGSERRRPDVIVEDLLVEEIVFPGDRLQVEATLRAIGYQNQTVQIKLRDKHLNRVIAQTTANFSSNEATERVRLAIRPDVPGELPLELSVEPQSDETDFDNNSIEQVVEVRDQKIRVLLAQSSPSYEFRSLKSLLERDPVVDLKVRLQEADAEFAEVDNTALRAFPSRAEELFEYDVILLGDVDPGILPRSVWPLLEEFVTLRGGGLACIAGPRFMPTAYRGNRSMELLLPIELAALNPLRWQANTNESFPVYPTALGWQAPSLQLGDTLAESESIWRGLPPVLWLLEIERTKFGAQVLAELPARTNRNGSRLPIILSQYVGGGEVLFHATDETWRWRWQTDDRYFTRYWGQAIRRLGRGRLASGREGVLVTTDRTRYQPGEAVRLQVRFRDPTRTPADDQGVVVQLQSDWGAPREVRLQRRLGLRGVFESTVHELAAGTYKVLLMRPELSDSSAQTQFVVRAPPRELARVAVDRTALSEVADITGGGIYTLTDLDELSRNLPRSRVLNQGELPPRPLWNTHGMLTLFVVVLCGEWILRRRYGML